MNPLVKLDCLVGAAAAPIPGLQALLDMDNPGPHMPAIKDLVAIVDDRLSRIADAVGRLKAAGGC